MSEVVLFKRTEPDPDDQAAALIEDIEKLTAKIRDASKGEVVEIRKRTEPPKDPHTGLNVLAQLPASARRRRSA